MTDLIVEEKTIASDDEQETKVEGTNGSEVAPTKPLADESFERLHHQAVSVTETMLAELKAFKSKVLSNLADERKKLDQDKANWARLSEKYRSHLYQVHEQGPVKLNVGGRVFTTAVDNLLREENTFFSGLFSGRWKLELDREGCIFIDRNPLCFDYVMAYLRGDGDLVLTLLTRAEIELLHREADFYQLHGLLRVTSSKLIRFDSASCSKSVVLSGSNTLARRTAAGSETEAIVFGPRLDPSKDEFCEHAIRLVSGTNVDFGVATVAFAKQAENDQQQTSNVQQQQQQQQRAGPLMVSATTPSTSSTYLRRFFVPVHSKVSVRLHKDMSLSFAVDDRPQGPSTTFTGLTNGPYVVAVILNSKNDCVELVS